MMSYPSTNEFVIRIANVNGTGSASANLLLAQSIFRYGVPIGPKNLFPSNIQGLPTWYEIRVSGAGHVGRLGEVHLMCSMNPQSFAKDLAQLTSGGYFIFDSTKYRDLSALRKDISYLPIPLTQLANDVFAEPKLVPLLKNVIYIGAIAYLIDLPMTTLADGLKKSFGKKQNLIDLNTEALSIGFTYAKEHFSKLPFGLAALSETREKTTDQILVDGNTALALGAVQAGATVCNWYPITPSTSVIDSFRSLCEQWRTDEDGKNNFAICQAEDEIAAIGMTLGAGWQGARSFTATSGPGLSLMAEFIGFSYYAEIPAVIFIVQRTGPSTGMPTRTQQADLLAAAYASHGDTKHILLMPGTVNECFQMSALAFDLAEYYQTTVLVMSDLDLGMNQWLSPEFSWQPTEISHNRGKVMDYAALDALEGKYHRYLDDDGDGISPRTIPATHPRKGGFLTRGSGHDRLGRYTEDGQLYQEVLEKIQKKIDGSTRHLPKPIFRGDHKASDVLLVFQGAIEDVVLEATEMMAASSSGSSGSGSLGSGTINTLAIKAFPFHQQILTEISRHKHVLIFDQNRDHQLAALLILELNIDPNAITKIHSYDGMPLTASALAALVSVNLNKKTNSSQHHPLSKGSVHDLSAQTQAKTARSQNQ